MKQYVGFSRDHSASMRHIAHVAARDYNSKVETIRTAATVNGIDTIVSVVECGAGRTSQTKTVVLNSSVSALKLIPDRGYIADGMGTPLYDSVVDLINIFKAVPDANSPDVSFLVMAITDGDENASRTTGSQLGAMIRQLEATDRWTFVFRVPRGAKAKVVRALGIHEGNVLEWDQTERGVQQAAQRDAEAFTEYFTGRTRGVTRTSAFYTDLSKVSSADVAATLTDISSEVTLWPVTEIAEIKPFVEARNNGELKRGAAFYQLTKKEDEVQENKIILVRDKTTQAIYTGSAARVMLGLNTYGTVRVVPGNHGNFDVFIQSTSVNRKLMPGTTVVYWENWA